MARAKPTTTKHPGIYSRDTKRGRVYDVMIRVPGEAHPRWERGKFTNLDLAYRFRIGWLEQALSGTLAPVKVKTFEDFVAEDWKPRLEARVQQGNLQENSRQAKLHDLDKHLLPAFEKQRVDRITTEMVERWQDDLSASGLSNYTVLRIVNTLGSVLELARRRKMIAHNPVRDVEKPKAERARQPIILTYEQVFKLARSSQAADECNLVQLCAFAGLRWGEAFGLRWENVELGEGAESLIVADTNYQGVLRLGQTKSASGNRQVILMPEAAYALRAQLVEGKSSDLGLVFPSPDGKPWRPSNWNRRRWQPLRQAAGLPELHFHDLRHFHVSHVRAMGLPSAVTEQLVGHSDSKTHRTYTHALEGTDALIRATYAAASEAAKGEGGDQ